MQNPNIPNAAQAAMNRIHPSRLESRSLSPNIQTMRNLHDYNEFYPNDLPMPQYYHSMPHKSTVMANTHEHIPPHNRTMSSLLHRTISPNISTQMQLQSSTAITNLPPQHPVNEFNEQYKRLQQARMQQLNATQSDAMNRKHQTFAMRQMLNPPTMSRQASAVNIHQISCSTQTTPNSHFQAIQPASTLTSQFCPNMNANNLGHHAEKPNHLQLQLEHQHLFRSLQNDYEQQMRQQLKATASTNPFLMQGEQIENRCDSGAQSPVHQTLVYKEPSSSSATSTPTKLLKSPKTKRAPTALVTFSGWLYKQGSDGLRVWRRRWFVLADYCLFYYKGPEEDKLLGSILLPSYQLSECMPTDTKTYRKYSFKLEHKNMRTYYLASENADYMRKWMRVIRAATLMQNFNEIQTRNMLANAIPISTSVQTTANYSHHGHDSFRNTEMHPSLNPFLIFDEDNERQPLYMNAPPKPRRTHNDMEFSMISHDPSMFTLSSETSKDSTPKGALPPRMYDYDEQRRNPINYYTDSAMNSQNYGLDEIAAAYKNELRPDNRKQFQQQRMPPRPRSADFLEYESKRHFRRYKDFDQSGHHERLPSRPKSSLDINSSMDNYHYSEASYAAKMRQSAVYLQNRNLMSSGRDDTRLNTLRYENERKRLTNEFQSYTANYMMNNSLASTLPRTRFVSDDSWQFSTLMRKNDPNSESNDGRFFLKDRYKSNDMISGNASSISRDDERYDQSSSQQNLNSVWSPDISAGTLLSKTHEELVLLLIQLRRQSDVKERGICRRLNDMQAIQSRLKSENNTGARLDLMGRLEILREEVNKMEQQYEKTKPLVNLVDNMVKLGSLYRAGSVQWDSNSMNSGANIQRLRLNQKDLERKLRLDEQKEWNKYDPNQIELHNKVQQLYELDQRLQEESNNLHMLQQDKDEIEGVLDELNRKFATNQMLPEHYVQSKKIQHSLELELSKVHSQMAENARRLEHTVSGNTQLERELLVLRQRLQANRDKSTGHLAHMITSGDERTADIFESELRKVRSSVGDIKRQREELSLAVSQLTLDSNAYNDRMKSSTNENLANTLKLQQNKRLLSDWTETDLDLMQKNNSRHYQGNYATNAYNEYGNEMDPYYSQQSADEMHSDDHWQGNDKQEIKTVRIVKRESERRQRDKDKINPMTYDPNIHNEYKNNDEINEFLSTYQAEPRISTFYEEDRSRKDDRHGPPSASKAKSTIKTTSNTIKTTTNTVHNDNINDIFQSNTAREILNELSSGKHDHNSKTTTKEPPHQMIGGGITATIQANQYKRFTPRKKKRHNTAPNSEGFIDYMAERNSFKYNDHRARDDLDMEVVLRSNPPIENAISGPPDIIRSALGESNNYQFDKMN